MNKFQKLAYLIVLFEVLNLNLSVIAADAMIQGTQEESTVALQWANRGVELFDGEDYPGAIAAFYESWKLNPAQAERIAQNLSIAYNNYGKQMAERKQMLEAQRQFRRAIFFDPTNDTARRNLDSLLQSTGVVSKDHASRAQVARRLRMEGFLEEAAAEYDIAIALTPNAKLAELNKLKLELAQLNQVLFAKYSQSPIAKNFYQKTLALCNELKASMPSDPKPLIIIGRANLTAQKLQPAVENFEDALRISSNDPSALDGLVAAWRKVVELAPRESNNLLGLGEALVRAGKPGEGKAVLERAKQTEPQRSGEIDKLIKSADELSARKNNIKLAERALKAQLSGDLQEAIGLYKQALGQLPPGEESAKVLYNMALIERKRGDLAAAKRYLSQAIKMNPADSLSASELKDLEFQEAQAQASRRDELNRKAIALQDVGKVDEAITTYRELLTSDPKDAQTHFNLGTAYQLQNNYEQALVQYKMAAKLAPDNATFAQAVKSLDEAAMSGALKIKLSSDKAKLALEKQTAGDINAALMLYREAIDLYPQSAQIHFNYATALQSQKKYADAIAAYSKAYRLEPENYVEANYFIGVLSEQLGDKEEALMRYRKYLEEQPTAEYAQSAKERIAALNHF